MPNCERAFREVPATMHHKWTLWKYPTVRPLVQGSINLSISHRLLKQEPSTSRQVTLGGAQTSGETLNKIQVALGSHPTYNSQDS